MTIKWAALADTAGISFLVTVAVVAAFALGVLALARRERAVESGTGRGTLALTGAGACFAACAAVTAYGISLIAG
ncbi:hypothetical protein C7C46_27160 [Streptomyces tateyamensis]|uniref:Uncharacterized protein n=1 Tax=Streptomyces tateyamensis TaxID=565073 RepID=A0A2V4N720_9ACTN|nr:hypothetical protein [Streptomyces tateyamensis]PYC70993.1 hypothetical protein C7C46_27160 [Streptomyces tateyamensis]